MQIALVSTVLALGLLLGMAAGVPVALTLVSTGIAAFLVGEGPEGLGFLANLPWAKSFSFELGSIPLFVFMGYLLQESGIVGHLFRMFGNWIGRVPGSLGVVVLFTSGIFAAMSGSGSAAAASLGAVTAPEARRYGFHPRLMLGILNGGASLSPVIPPSIALIVYGTLADQSVTRLFAAGVIPGLLALALMLAYVITLCIMRPDMAPQPPRATWAERVASLWVLAPSGALIALMLGGLFLGWFTPTEAAAVAVMATLALLAMLARFEWRKVVDLSWRALMNTGTTTAFVLFLVVSGFIYSHTLTFFGLPQQTADLLSGAGLKLWQLYTGLVLLLLILGCFVDSLTMQVMTVPFLLPLLQQMGVDLIWFGVFVVLMVEVGTLTPPFGIHIFILQGVTGASYEDAVLGALPFAVVWTVAVVILIVFPALATWLPSVLF